MASLDNAKTLEEKRAALIIKYRNLSVDSIEKGEDMLVYGLSKDDKKYLMNIAESMWTLSSHVFSNTYFSYRTLASFAGEPDVEKVKIAVRRINIISISYLARSKNETLYDDSGPLSIGLHDWAWRMQINDKNECDFISIYDIIEAIKVTGVPHVVG